MTVRTRKEVIEELEMSVLSFKNGHATRLSTVSPTSGKRYIVRLIPIKTSTGYGFKTFCIGGHKANFEPCKGNQTTVCKHSLAAVLHRMKIQGKKFYKCNTLEDATRLNNILKGSVFTISSSSGRAYGVVVEYPVIEVKERGEACSASGRRLEGNVRLMRDTEKFID